MRRFSLTMCAALCGIALVVPGRTRAQTDSLLTASIDSYTGVSGRVDNERAKRLLLRAVADNDPISIMWLARVYSRGRMSFEQDSVRARAIAEDVIEAVEALAEDDIAEAVFLMGTAYDEGLGKTPDIGTAISWYRRAAALGNVLAQHNLGNLYSAGRGVPQSDSLAVHWWRQAAEQGDAIPQLRLGTMYEEGRGVARDLARARQWYERSARRGNADAQAALDRLPRGGP